VQHYYVNKQAQSNGDHEVHVPRCSYLPDPENSVYLGAFTDCREAVNVALARYDKANGCYWCCNTCHTG
jgi:hypothetical protein